MADLVGLAARVEAATGPDLELDCLIWCAVNGYKPEWQGKCLVAGIEGVIGWIDPGKHQRNFHTNRSTVGPGSIPAYSASLDAAMTLVPEGAKVIEFQQDSCHDWAWWAWVSAPGEYEGNAHNQHAPLALTAACLKARATTEGKSHE